MRRIFILVPFQTFPPPARFFVGDRDRRNCSACFLSLATINTRSHIKNYLLNDSLIKRWVAQWYSWKKILSFHSLAPNRLTVSINPNSVIIIMIKEYGTNGVRIVVPNCCGVVYSRVQKWKEYFMCAIPETKGIVLNKKQPQPLIRGMQER